MRAERFPVVSVLDEAIDTTSMPFETMMKYYDTRDVALLQPYMKPSARPTVYHIRPAPHSMWFSYIAAGGDTEQIRRAFMCGVERVENLPGKDGVGVNWMPTRRVNESLTVMTEEECNERFSPYEVFEIGSVIHRHSFLPLRTSLHYPLPSLCVEALTHRPFLSAEPSPSTAIESSSPPSAAIDRPMEATANS